MASLWSEHEGDAPGKVLRRRIAMTRRSDWRPAPLQADFVELARVLAKERAHKAR